MRREDDLLQLFWDFWSWAWGMLGVFIMLYMLKSALGINIFDKSSPADQFLTDIGLCHKGHYVQYEPDNN